MRPLFSVGSLIRLYKLGRKVKNSSGNGIVGDLNAVIDQDEEHFKHDGGGHVYHQRDELGDNPWGRQTGVIE